MCGYTSFDQVLSYRIFTLGNGSHCLKSTCPAFEDVHDFWRKAGVS